MSESDPIRIADNGWYDGKDFKNLMAAQRFPMSETQDGPEVDKVCVTYGSSARSGCDPVSNYFEDNADSYRIHGTSAAHSSPAARANLKTPSSLPRSAVAPVMSGNYAAPAYQPSSLHLSSSPSGSAAAAGAPRDNVMASATLMNHFEPSNTDATTSPSSPSSSTSVTSDTDADAGAHPHDPLVMSPSGPAAGYPGDSYAATKQANESSPLHPTSPSSASSSSRRTAARGAPLLSKKRTSDEPSSAGQVLLKKSRISRQADEAPREVHNREPKSPIPVDMWEPTGAPTSTARPESVRLFDLLRTRYKDGPFMLRNADGYKVAMVVPVVRDRGGLRLIIFQLFAAGIDRRVCQEDDDRLSALSNALSRVTKGEYSRLRSRLFFQDRHQMVHVMDGTPFKGMPFVAPAPGTTNKHVPLLTLDVAATDEFPALADFPVSTREGLESTLSTARPVGTEQITYTVPKQAVPACWAVCGFELFRPATDNEAQEVVFRSPRFPVLHLRRGKKGRNVRIVGLPASTTTTTAAAAAADAPTTTTAAAAASATSPQS